MENRAIEQSFFNVVKADKGWLAMVFYCDDEDMIVESISERPIIAWSFDSFVSDDKPPVETATDTLVYPMFAGFGNEVHGLRDLCFLLYRSPCGNFVDQDGDIVESKDIPSVGDKVDRGRLIKAKGEGWRK